MRMAILPTAGKKQRAEIASSAILIWFKFIFGAWSEVEICFKGGKNARVG
jgi:hypothetical protein